jgi:hypothetical protein
MVPVTATTPALGTTFLRRIDVPRDPWVSCTSISTPSDRVTPLRNPTFASNRDAEVGIVNA